jgi:Na+-translocating ferredoxin:NAD+ oxidoreductase RnfD subunit
MTAWQAPDIFMSLADALHIIFSGAATVDGLSSATILDSIKIARASAVLLTEIQGT